jgi:predicted metal-dependent peptidase
MAKLTAEQRIERCHIQLMKHPKFCLFSGLFMVGKVSVDDKVPTARTNGLSVVYGRGFIESLNDKQLAFLILHENMHKAYRHLIVWKHLHKKNATLANMACDYVINIQLHDYDPKYHEIEFPTDENGKQIGLLDEKYRGMDSAEVFKLLEKELGEDYGKGERGEGDGHEFDEHDWEGANELTEEEVEDSAKEIEDALRQGSILVGKMKGDVSPEIKDLLTPKIDWKEALRDFVKSTMKGKDQTTWKRLHKRYIGMDIVMPSSYSEKVGSMCIAVDVSGSCISDLPDFLSEVKSICEEVSPECMHLLYWDSAVEKHEIYVDNEVANAVDVTQARGGGGTSPECVPKYLVKENISPECLIMFTDGYINDQKPKHWNAISPTPVLWCVKGNSHFNPNSVQGKVIHVE